jgi:hypothetical protein
MAKEGPGHGTQACGEPGSEQAPHSGTDGGTARRIKVCLFDRPGIAFRLVLGLLFRTLVLGMRAASGKQTRSRTLWRG